MPSFHNVGYPIAEIEADGSFTITKHPNTGGLISVGTVTAQLLYEISAPAYVNPDVIAHFDSLNIEQVGEDRVRISGVRGSNPPPTHKVCINTADGFKTGIEILLTGLDIEEKAEIFTDVFFESLGGREAFDKVETQLIRTDRADANQNEEAQASLEDICPLERCEQSRPAVFRQAHRAGAGELPRLQRPRRQPGCAGDRLLAGAGGQQASDGESAF